MDKPLVSICIPTLGRPEALARCLAAIQENTQDWPYEVLVEHDSFENRQGCPKILARAVARSKGAYVVFIGNDCVPQGGWLSKAMEMMLSAFPDGVGMVGFFDGYWAGEVATHWLAAKALLPALGGYFFQPHYNHVGCDCELTQRCRVMGRYYWCPEAKVLHMHPIHNGMQSGVDEVYQLAYNPKAMAADRETLHRRAAEFGFPVWEDITPPRIPRRIYSIWLGSEPPEIVKKCLATHKIPGWEHRMITLDNCDRSVPYVRECLERREWVKAADYLRIWYLYHEGGIYLDADCEITKPCFFDTLLTARLFACREENNFIAIGNIGAEAGHPALKRHLDRVDRECRADDGKVFEDGMLIWTDTLYQSDREAEKIVIHDPEVFFPYNHQTGKIHETARTLAWHHFTKSWVAPIVSPRMNLHLRLPAGWREMKVLNVGVGSGESDLAKQLPHLPFKRLDHIEVHEPYIKQATKRTWAAQEVNYFLGDVRAFPVEDYDLVMAFDVLEHLTCEDAVAVMSKCRRTLVFIPIEDVPHCERDGIDHIPSQDHLSTWTPEAFEKMGFEVQVLKDFHRQTTGTWDAMWAWRF